MHRVVEGPIGGSKRGAWLFSARKSYLDLIVERLYPEQNLSFGFADTQAKLTYDVTPRHQVQVAFTGGRSRLERAPDLLGAGNLRDATNQSALAVLTWRYLPSPRVSLIQRAAVVENRFRNSSRDGAELGRRRRGHPSGGRVVLAGRACSSKAAASAPHRASAASNVWSPAGSRHARRRQQPRLSLSAVGRVVRRLLHHLAFVSIIGRS
jgi:hypothetical protein